MATEVGSAYFTLLPTVKGLQGAIGKEVAGINGSAAGATIGKSMGGGIAGSLKAAVGPAIAAIGIGSAFNFAKGAVDSFSELEDSSAAASVVFGNNMNQIIQQSKTAGTNLGLSEQQVISAANTFGTYGKAAGLSGKELADFATQQTALAADMASFKGTSPEQAIEAIGAALRGETEPIRAYGVMLDDASMRQEALKMGLISTTKDALTPQQKTLAAQSLILKQTSDAQGDFARTSQSTANIAKTLAAEQENLSAKMGTVLAPAFTAVRKTALEGVRGLSGFTDKVISAQKALSEGGTNIEIGKAMGITGPALAVFDEGLGAVRAFRAGLAEGGEVTSGGFAGTLEGIGIAIHGVLDGFGQFMTGLTSTSDSIVAMGDKLTPLTALGYLVRDAFTSAFAPLGPMFAELGPLVLQLFQAFSPLSLIFQAIGPLLPVIAGALGQLAAAVGGALVSALSAAMPALTALSAVLVDALGTVFAAVAPVIVSLLGQLGQLFAELGPVIGSIVGTVANLVAQLVSALMPIFLQLVTAVMPMVVQVFFAVAQAVVPLVTQIAGFLIPIIQALLPVVVMVFQAVASVIQSVMQIVMGVIQVVTGIISGNWSQVWNGIKNVLAGVWNLIVGVIRGALAVIGSVVIAGVNLVGSWIRSGFQNASNFVSAIWNGIMAFISGVWNRITSTISGGVSRAASFIRSGFQGAANFLSGIWNNIINGVSGLMGRVTGFFSGLGGKILGALGNVGSTLYNAGRDIVQGLINGIGSMMGSIGRAVLNIVPAAIRGPFEDLMGIRSPSRVAMWWGEMIGDGLVGSIEDQYSRVAGAVSGLVTAPPVTSLAMAGTRAGYDVSQAPGMAPVVVEQHIYPAADMSEQNLADLVGRNLVRAGK